MDDGNRGAASFGGCGLCEGVEGLLGWTSQLFLSTWILRTTANNADKILAKTVLHQIMTCPPNSGGRMSIRTNINSGSINVKI